MQAVLQCVRHRLGGQSDETLLAFQAGSLSAIQALPDAQETRHCRWEQSHQQECQGEAASESTPACRSVIRHNGASQLLVGAINAQSL
jgi:hypothetical protein